MLTQSRLKELLHYNPETGVFTWLVNVCNVKAGHSAGSLNSRDGYLRMKVAGERHQAHRLAWFYVHGVWPEHQLDHKNGRRADNWIANLREATNSQNHQNRTKAKINSKSGFLGVSRHGEGWRADIGNCGDQIYLGSFPTPELASAAYLSAKQGLHPFSTF